MLLLAALERGLFLFSLDHNMMVEQIGLGDQAAR
jgi:hypothetical protein